MTLFLVYAPVMPIPTSEELARAAYADYGATTDWKNYQGLPMPAWEDLPETIRTAWRAAVRGTTARVLSAYSQDMKDRED